MVFYNFAVSNVKDLIGPLCAGVVGYQHSATKSSSAKAKEEKCILNRM